MSDAAVITCIHPDDRVVADPTPGKVREQAIAVNELWSGFVRTEPGVASGWHHHGEHDTSVYVIAGKVRIEFRNEGVQTVEAGPGDFVHIPRHLVHREVNPGPEPSQEIISRAGTGPVTINVEN